MLGAFGLMGELGWLNERLVAEVAFSFVLFCGLMVCCVWVREWLSDEFSFGDWGVFGWVFRWSVFFLLPWLVYFFVFPLGTWGYLSLVLSLFDLWGSFGSNVIGVSSWVDGLDVRVLMTLVLYLPAAAVYSRVRLDHPGEERVYLYGVFAYFWLVTVYQVGRYVLVAADVFMIIQLIFGAVVLGALLVLVVYMLVRAWRSEVDELFGYTLLMYSSAIALLLMAAFFHIILLDAVLYARG